ncbi:hypothetical protein ACFOWX_02570 [Sphingorhabdus arenilitoris]|uniref:Serine protease n=1 Tax=Sphingorhabdus arenilitoris TaxID=1490041 RepID=A0ABV8REB1_9SPHN
MNRLVDFIRSDLFLSLAGGFALGLAGIAFINPASAVSNQDAVKSVTVETTSHGEIEIPNRK